MNETILSMAFLLFAGCAVAPKAAGYKDNTGTPGTLRILMSTNEPGFTEVLTGLLRTGIGHKYNLLIEEIPEANKLLEHAQSVPIDIFILILNNMLIPGASYSSHSRVKEALNVLSHIKKKYKKPVIAMAGWPDDPGFGEEARSAGANFFFRLPFEGQEFQQAVESCINIIFEKNIKF
jgi:hypothetical protein